MTVYKSGTLVKIKLSNQNAYISEVVIGEGYILYKVSYFYEGDLKLPLIAEFEFDLVCGNVQQIGFK